jgi:hypothetical protein
VRVARLVSDREVAGISRLIVRPRSRGLPAPRLRRRCGARPR